MFAATHHTPPASSHSCHRQHSVLVNRGWVPPNWKAEWQQHFMAQQPQGRVSVSGVVQGSESPSSYVPDNAPQQGLFFWMDVPGLVSCSCWGGGGAERGQRCARLVNSVLIPHARALKN